MSGNSVSISIPTKLTLTLDPTKVFAAAGNKGAKVKREELRSGMGSDGPLPTDLQDTGTLIKSTQYMPVRMRGFDGKLQRSKYSGGNIYPRGRRDRPGKNGTIRNMAILAILLATFPGLAEAGPMIISPKMRQEMIAAAQKNVDKQRKGISAGGRKKV